MRQRISLGLTLFAWLLATGGQWDLVQTFAWTRMIANYAQTMPLVQAVEKTFGGQEQCEICVIVEDAKREQAADNSTPGNRSVGKILLVCTPSEQVLADFVAQSVGLVPTSNLGASAERAAPPNPPPRSLS